MTAEEEFIRQTKVDWEDKDHPINSLQDALEVNYMNGNYDNLSGDVDAPTGHFYIIEQWILVTDSQGNKIVQSYESPVEAETAFNKLEADYDEWSM
jgi:hypothetical protein